MTDPARAILPLVPVALVALLALVPGCASPEGELEDVRSDDQEDRIDAAIALAEGLDAKDPDYEATRAEIAAELHRLLDDKSALVRQVAIRELARVEGHAAAGAITRQLQNQDAWVRFAAVRTLGEIRAESAVESLAEILRKDESPDVRRAAAQALGKLKARSGIRDLYLALQDVPAVRMHAYFALRDITGEDRGEDPRAWRAAIPRGPGE